MCEVSIVQVGEKCCELLTLEFDVALSMHVYLVGGSVSPIMYPCGADDLICPSGSVSPIQVQEGFYTTTEWSEGCKPGIT